MGISKLKQCITLGLEEWQWLANWWHRRK